MQTSFLSIVCNRTKPKPSSADADFIAICDASTERYLCKGQSNFPHLPATEWICSSLARDCGLPVPDFAVIELQSNPDEYLFGSRWLGGGVDWTEGLHRVSNPKIFSDTVGFDFFSHNDDRHLGNFLYLDIAGDIVLRPMDFSRAWLHHGWPLPPLPLPITCNTIMWMPEWRGRHAYIAPFITLDNIAALPLDWMENTIYAMPQVWLTETQKTDLISWWQTIERQVRVNMAKSHLP